MKVFLPRATDTTLVTVYDGPIDLFREHNPEITFVDEAGDADLIVLFEEWRTQFEEYGETLRADRFVSSHWPRIYTVNCDDLGRGFLPGCYTSLNPRNFDRALHRTCAYPYGYNELPGAEERGWRPRWLFSFRGTDASHPLRRRLFGQLEAHSRGRMVCVRTAFHAHVREQKLEYVRDIIDSAFALCPRGWSPSTYRLFEVMELGRCPVIISDDWLPVEGPDWEACSIRVPERYVDRLPMVLSAREAEAEALGRAARKAWEEHFSEQKKFRAMARSILELYAEGGTEDYRTRWACRRFRRANGFLAHQRIVARIERLRAMAGSVARHIVTREGVRT